MQYRRRWGLIWWRAVLIAKRVEGAWFWQSCRRRRTKSGVVVQREWGSARCNISKHWSCKRCCETMGNIIEMRIQSRKVWQYRIWGEVCECWMSVASTCIQGKMEVKLEMFHCHIAHLFAVRSSSLASQYIMRLCCKVNIWVDYGQPKLWAKNDCSTHWAD